MCFCIKNYIVTQSEDLSTVQDFNPIPTPVVYATDFSKVLALFLFCVETIVQSVISCTWYFD